MKHKWLGGLAVVALLFVSFTLDAQAQAGKNPDYNYSRFGVTIKVNLDIDTSTALGSVFNDSTVASATFMLPFDAPVYLKIVAKDTSSVEGLDTIIIALQKSVEVRSESNESVVSDWLNVAAWPASTNGTDYPLSWYLPLDSIRLGTYPIGGLHRFVAYEGSVEDATVTTGRWEFDCFVEAVPFPEKRR